MRLATVMLVLSVPLALGPLACGPKGPPNEAKIIKAPVQPPVPPPRKATRLNPDLLLVAREQILSAGRSSDEVIRAHGIEAMKQVYLPSYENLLLKGLQDDSPIVRKSSAIACGELKLESALPFLEKLADDTDMQVRVATRFALHRLGDTRRSQDFAVYARDPDRSIRADAAMLLGMLGEKSAIRILEVLFVDREEVVRLQAAEAMWKLGDEAALADLVGASVSAYPDDQMIAFTALAGPRDARVMRHIEAGLVSDYIEISLVAARSLGQLGSDDGYAIAARATQDKSPRVRALAALALGAIERADAQGLLAPLLKDEFTEVKLASALAMLQLKE